MHTTQQQNNDCYVALETLRKLIDNVIVRLEIEYMNKTQNTYYIIDTCVFERSFMNIVLNMSEAYNITNTCVVQQKQLADWLQRSNAFFEK